MSSHKQIGTTNLKPGWHEGLPMASYLSDPAVSASRLWSLHCQTPAHLKAELEAGAEPVTDAKELGEVTHTAVYEPDEFERRYVILGQCEAKKKGDGERCSNAGTVYREGQSYCGVKGHDPNPDAPMDPGVVVVQESVRDCASDMKTALFADPTAGSILRLPGPREVTGIARDPETGLWCRIRPDELIEEQRSTYDWSVVNLKTTGKLAAPTKFPRDAEFMGLYFKAAFYRMVIRTLWPVEPQNFLYPVVESFGKHQVIVYRMNDDALDIGEAEVREALSKLARAVETGVWPSYGPALHDLRLSDWRMKQAQAVEFLEVA